MTRILITRPTPDAARTAAAFERSGFETRILPMMTISLRSVAAPPILPQAIAVTSANGVRAYAAQSWASDVPVFCVGPASADAARHARLTVAGVAGASVESLAQVIADKAIGPVLHIRGADAAGDLCASLSARGKTADALVLYDAIPTTALPSDFEDWMAASAVGVTLFSPRTARLFAQLVAHRDGGASLHHATALCLSPAVAEAARSLSFRHFRTATAPTEDALIDTAISLRT